MRQHGEMTALDTVNRFMQAASARDYDTALGLLADDIEYQNMPLPAVTGRQAVRETLDICWPAPSPRSGSCTARSPTATSS